MADNKHSDDPYKASPPAVPAWGGALGRFVLYAGVALLFVLMFWQPDISTVLRYVAIAMIVAGVALWLLSTTSRLQALEWLKSGLIALFLALIIRWGIAEPYRIPSGSMEPTLLGDPRIFRGDRVFVNKFVYGLRYPFMNQRIWYGQEPQRWELVVFKSVEDDAEHGTLVKRIVGMPGEHVHIREGKVFVDGEALEIPDFMSEDTRYTAPAFGFSQMRYGVLEDEEYSVIPEDHYFLLGDNSGNSRDGRYFGWVPNEHLVGRVFSIWWPPSSWRDFTGFTQTWWWRSFLGLIGFWIVARIFVGRSWVIRAEQDDRLEHLYVHFLALGLRIPFTRFWLYQWGKAERGDVVLYWPSGLPEPQLGRIAGLPGEQVTLVGGKLHVNGEPADGPQGLIAPFYPMNEKDAKYGKPGKETRVPDGRYYILTDQTLGGPAPDSRTLGWIPQQRLVGVVKATWWPWSRRGRTH